MSHWIAKTARTVSTASVPNPSTSPRTVPPIAPATSLAFSMPPPYYGVFIPIF